MANLLDFVFFFAALPWHGESLRLTMITHEEVQSSVAGPTKRQKEKNACIQAVLTQSNSRLLGYNSKLDNYDIQNVNNLDWGKSFCCDVDLQNCPWTLNPTLIGNLMNTETSTLTSCRAWIHQPQCSMGWVAQIYKESEQCVQWQKARTGLTKCRDDFTAAEARDAEEKKKKNKEEQDKAEEKKKQDKENLKNALENAKRLNILDSGSAQEKLAREEAVLATAAILNPAFVSSCCYSSSFVTSSGRLNVNDRKRQLGLFVIENCPTVDSQSSKAACDRCAHIAGRGGLNFNMGRLIPDGKGQRVPKGGKPNKKFLDDLKNKICADLP